MKQYIAAWTSSAQTYPEFINISCNDSGDYEIIIREQCDLSGEHPKDGRVSMITIPSNAFMALVDELNEKF
jgi:hypothetical protein